MGFFDGLFESETESQSWNRRLPYEPTDQWLNQMIHRVGNIPPQRYYEGNLTAQLSPQYKQAIQRGFDWQRGRGGHLTRQMQRGGQMGVNAIGQGMQLQNALRKRGPNQFNYDQGTYDQVMGNLMPGLQGQFDAAMRDPNRQFAEQTIPGINMATSAAGQGFGSTRGFNQGAIAARGLNDRAADVASGLWTNAANQANQAAFGAGSQNLGTANQFDQNLMANYGRFGQLGRDMLRGAWDMGTGNIGLANKSGEFLRNYNQQRIDRDAARVNFNRSQNQQNPFTKLQTLANVGNMYGRSFGTTEGTSTPSPMAQFGSTVGMLGSVGSMFAGNPAFTMGTMNDFGTGIQGFGSYDWGSLMPSTGGGWGGWNGQDPGGYWT
jgi:hypothetical protein